MDRTIGKSQNRNYDGERLMKILESYKKMMNEFIGEAKITARRDKISDRPGEKAPYKTAGGYWAGKHKGEIEYFDDKEKAQNYIKYGAEGDNEPGGATSDEPEAGKLGGSDFDRDAQNQKDADDWASKMFGAEKDKVTGGGDSEKVDGGDEPNPSQGGMEFNPNKLGPAPSAPQKDGGLPDWMKDRKKNKAADDEADDMDRDARFDADAEDEKDDELPPHLQPDSPYHSDNPNRLMRTGKELSRRETININGKQYRAISEEKKKSNPRVLKEIYNRTFRSLK